MLKRDLLNSIKSHLKTKGFTCSYIHFDSDWSIIVESLSIVGKNGDTREVRNIPRVRVRDSLIRNFPQIKDIYMTRKDGSAPLFSFHRYRHVKIILNESSIDELSAEFEYWKNNLLFQGLDKI